MANQDLHMSPVLIISWIFLRFLLVQHYRIRQYNTYSLHLIGQYPTKCTQSFTMLILPKTSVKFSHVYRKPQQSHSVVLCSTPLLDKHHLIFSFDCKTNSSNKFLSFTLTSSCSLPLSILASKTNLLIPLTAVT